jgi:hypothetical protein
MRRGCPLPFAVDQPAAGEKHVDDAERQDRHAEGGEAEEVESLVPMAD